MGSRAAFRRMRVASDIQIWMNGLLKRHITMCNVIFTVFKYIHTTDANCVEKLLKDIQEMNQVLVFFFYYRF